MSSSQLTNSFHHFFSGVGWYTTNQLFIPIWFSLLYHSSLSHLLLESMWFFQYLHHKNLNSKQFFQGQGCQGAPACAMFSEVSGSRISWNSPSAAPWVAARRCRCAATDWLPAEPCPGARQKRGPWSLGAAENQEMADFYRFFMGFTNGKMMKNGNADRFCWMELVLNLFLGFQVGELVSPDPGWSGWFWDWADLTDFLWPRFAEIHYLGNLRAIFFAFFEVQQIQNTHLEVEKTGQLSRGPVRLIACLSSSKSHPHWMSWSCYPVFL